MIYLLEHIEAIPPEAVHARLGDLTSERRARIASLRPESARLQSALAELLLRYALRREYGLAKLPEISIATKGKPFFNDLPECHFNLSHCAAAVACALDGAPVGVDVQELRGYRPGLARVLSEPERLWVEAEDSDARFTQLWTLKEAFGKASGEGILYDLRSTLLVPREGVWEAQGQVFQSFARQGCFLSVCAKRALPLSVVSAEELLSRNP